VIYKDKLQTYKNTRWHYTQKFGTTGH